LDVLECSIHGHGESYERLMRNGQEARVRANVIHFRELRDTMASPTRLVVSAVDQPGLQVDKAAHRAFWSQYADQVIYRPYHSWGNRVDATASEEMPERRPCSQLWNRCTIGPTGKVLACFNSWSEPEDEVLGDLREKGSSITAIWQSARATGFRQRHLQGDYDLACCRTCKDWVGSAWGKNSYEHLLRVKLELRNTNNAH
jgi:radical SAM protein with 4Fe4S-binding SPASM domain